MKEIVDKYDIKLILDVPEVVFLFENIIYFQINTSLPFDLLFGNFIIFTFSYFYNLAKKPIAETHLVLMSMSRKSFQS